MLGEKSPSVKKLVATGKLLRHSFQKPILLPFPAPREGGVFPLLILQCFCVKKPTRHVCLPPLAALNHINSQTHCVCSPPNQKKSKHVDFPLAPKWRSRRWEFTFTHPRMEKKWKEEQKKYYRQWKKKMKNILQRIQHFRRVTQC